MINVTFNQQYAFIRIPAIISVPIGLIGFALNLGLLYTIISSKRLKDPTYILISNVIINDCLNSLQLIITCISPFILLGFSPEVGKVFCKILFYTYCSTYNTSVYSLTAISVYRNRMITQAIRMLSHNQQCKYMVRVAIGIWAISLLISIPSIFIVSCLPPPIVGCDISYPSDFPNFTVVFFFTVTIITYVLPLIIITINYTRIAKQILYKVQPRQSTDTRNETDDHRRNRVIKMLIVVTAAFMFFAWPFLICVDIIALHRKTFHMLSLENYNLYVICFVTLPINTLVSILNPVLYIIFDTNIRIEAKKYLLDKIICISR